MAYRSFRKFLDALDEAGELKRVAVPVDTDLLIAEWADREMKSPGGGKALLFEQPIVDGKKSEFPVAINTMGSRRRMALALQVAEIADIAQEIQLILKAKPHSCPMVWMKFFSRVFFEKNRSSSFVAKQSMSMFRPTSILCWKVMCNPARCNRRGRLAITRVSIPRWKTIRYST